MQWIMTDLETLDTKPTAVILSIGAVRFDPLAGTIGDKLILRPDVDEQFALGRTYSEDTLNWWQTQSKEAQDAAFNGTRISLNETIKLFDKFVWNHNEIWSQGSFDIEILTHLYGQLNKSVPWQYWMASDSRTLFKFVDGNMDRSKHHDAVEDCIAQANAVIVALKKIGWSGDKL